jgi:RecB family exonuclease
MQDLTPAPRALVRTRGVSAFRDALVALATAGDAPDAVRRVVIVPTRAAAELLRQTMEARLGAARPALILPACLTRDEWMTRMHDALPRRQRLLSRTEREVLLARAARRTAARPRAGGAPFELRPGLVGALLDFYDELNRRQRRVRRFARVLFDQLRVERGTDRGSESLLHQTAFMGLTFLAYERSLAAIGALDEHALRRELVSAQPPLPFDHLVIAVADHPSDPRGLWPADFDFIGRLRALTRVDVVVTDETHDAGFRERIERELPGIEERRHHLPSVVYPRMADSADSADRADRADRADGSSGPACVISRDREEELRAAARTIRQRAAGDGDVLREPTAIVFQRPLPYVYLARQVLAEEGIPYEAFDALPLAAEPYAAMLDLVLAFARTGGTRDAAAALLRCRTLEFSVDGARVELEDVSALSSALAARRATGDAASYGGEVRAWFGDRPSRDRVSHVRAARAATAAGMVQAELAPFRTAATASAQVRTLSSFIRAHEIHPRPDDLWRERHLRARAAVLAILDALADAFEQHDDDPRDEAALTAAIRHALEGQMFTPRRGSGGVRLIEAAAARFGDFDHVHVVGLVDSDWPERTRRSIFFTSGLLKALGWPQEPDELRGHEAAFRDLLGLAARTTTLHAFELEGDSVAVPSAFLAHARETAGDSGRAAGCGRGDDDRAAREIRGVASDDAARFLRLRQLRPPLDDRRYTGHVPPRVPGAYRVSAVDRYVDCPFKYFAEAILKLPEERPDLPGLTPIERGTLVHDLFERFYRAWDEGGGGTITPATLPDALALFAALAGDALAPLPDADRALEETRLLGSIVGRGLGERVFELEADAGGRIVRRLLEHELRGPYGFPRVNADGPDGGLARTAIDIRGKADRIDVFDDDSIRVVDYKLGALPDLEASVQVAVYAHAVRQLLERTEGRPFTIRGAMYLAFGDDRTSAGSLGDRETPPARAVHARASAFAQQVGRIEAGEFPPRPRRPADCRWCAAAGVCRKEYVTDTDDAAEPV